MNITVIKYGGTEYNIECESFEFRTNRVDNWIRIKYRDGSKQLILNVATIKTESGDKKGAKEETDGNNDYTWAKELIMRTGLAIAPEDGSKPYGYDCEDKVWRSDVIDLFGHGSTYTSEETQKMIKELPSAD